MILLRGKLMGNTFDVGRVTVMRPIPRKHRKVHIICDTFDYFDYFDNFLELSIQQIAILCPFSADRSSELIRRKKFSDI